MKTLVFGKDDLKAVIGRPGLDYGKTISYVAEIVEGVRAGGDKALMEYTQKFDSAKPKQLRVSGAELSKAFSSLDSQVVKALERAHRNIRSLHLAQNEGIRREWMHEVTEGVLVGEKITPLESVGCYVPGGRASYPSTVLMTVVPAKIAGVKRVVVVSPPPISDEVLAACKIAGADEVYHVGGAQAVAALAYGTESIKPVVKIVGPGNKFVTAAKMLVFGAVDIDMPAGPSEVLIIADDSANPEYIAADVLAQAEHDPNAQCVLATDSKTLAKEVCETVEKEAKSSEKKEILQKSLANFTVVLTKSTAESIAFSNQYAPEHLEIHTRRAEDDAKKTVNAGAIFIGPYSPVAAGDYASGGNHVLPTSGAAKYSSQLSVRDFLKSSNMQMLTKEGLKKISATITTIARQEGLTEHAKSVEKRLQ
jgi:histidinol dehydrogenase